MMTNQTPTTPNSQIEAKETEPLEALYLQVEKQVTEAIEWYLAKKQSKAWLSKWLRLFTILFGVIGGLIPLLYASGALGKDPIIGMYGYVFIASAGACVVFDKFFGVTSPWLRYMQSALSLQQLLGEMRIDWVQLSVSSDIGTTVRS
jgi:hypothetical protein